MLLSDEKQQLLHDKLSDIAKTYHIWLVAGSIPTPSPDPNKMFATAWCFDPSGELVAQYNKTHLFDVSITDNTGTYQESATTLPGSDVVILDTEFGRVGICICYDIRFSTLFNAMVKENAIDYLVVPAAFTYQTGQAHWHLMQRARAVEASAFVISAAQVGNHEDGRQTYGHSLVIDPWGEVLLDMGGEKAGLAAGKSGR